MGSGRLPALLATALLGAGCLVQVEKVSDPGPAFAAARRQAARVQGSDAAPGHLEVLVYDREEGHLVRASLPLWLVRRMDERGDLDFDLDREEEAAASRVRRHLRLKDLERAGCGVLVEVEEEDGDQVLVWLR
jgi:hypothetical protein